MPRNLSIDWRRPPTSPSSTAAGAAAPPGEVDIIIGRPIGRARSSPRIPDQQFLQKEVAAAFHQKEIAAAPPRRPDQIERVSLSLARGE